MRTNEEKNDCRKRSLGANGPVTDWWLQCDDRIMVERERDRTSILSDIGARISICISRCKLEIVDISQEMFAEHFNQDWGMWRICSNYVRQLQLICFYALRRVTSPFSHMVAYHIHHITHTILGIEWRSGSHNATHFARRCTMYAATDTENMVCMVSVMAMARTETCNVRTIRRDMISCDWHRWRPAMSVMAWHRRSVATHHSRNSTLACCSAKFLLLINFEMLWMCLTLPVHECWWCETKSLSLSNDDGEYIWKKKVQKRNNVWLRHNSLLCAMTL